jgi:glutamate dehydrogenase/leucine dehydrogenase
MPLDIFKLEYYYFCFTMKELAASVLSEYQRLEGGNGINSAEEMLRNDFERIYHSRFRDLPIAAEAYTAVHNTTLAKNNPYDKSLGGLRVIAEGSDDPERLACELARDMTKKWLLAFRKYKQGYADGNVYPWELESMRVGGGKSVMVVSDLNEYKKLTTSQRTDLFRQFGEHINKMEGLHTTAPDMGTTSDDMVIVQKSTQHVACLPESTGGSGDPSPNTALLVKHAAEAVMREVGVDPDRATYSIQGVGNVGRSLVEAILRDHPRSTIIISDLDKKRVQKLKSDYWSVEIVEPDDFWKTPSDIVMPCAGANILNRTSLEQMPKGPQIVCGSANDQYPVVNGEPDPRMVRKFRERSKLVVPAVLANSGGIENLASERWAHHEMPDQMTPELREIRMHKLATLTGPFVVDVYRRAQNHGVSFEQEANYMAAETLAAVMKGII